MISSHRSRHDRIAAVALLAAISCLASPARADERPLVQSVTARPSQGTSASPTVVAVPVPLPLPGQLKRFPHPVLTLNRGRPHRVKHPAGAAARVEAANQAARIEPERTGFVNAIQQYPFAEGALYQVYARPGAVTDIELQAGEELVGTGPVAAGDTVRWLIGDTISGAAPRARVHILVKPVRPGIATNLVINTDRRTYHIELHASASVYMASVSWTYPQDALFALRQAKAGANRVQPVAQGLDLAHLDFRYAIEGDKPDWRPLRAFDDGSHVYVEFPAAIAQGDLPPLFVLGAHGETELVNYRVAGRYMIVDRLFSAAELRLGGHKRQDKVRIIASRRGRP